MSEPTTLENGRYVLEGILGSGGMAVVYRAWDTRLKVHRAVKLLYPQFASDSHVRQRFENEAQAMVRIRHPNVLTVHDVGEDGDKVYIVMELEEGGSLARHVGAYGAIPPRMAVSCMIKVLEALAAAHKVGIIHRDIKPHNVLLSRDGEPKVADFGIAHVTGDHSMLTATGAVLGTFAYMAPEQLEDTKGADGRTDLYAAAATLYVMLTERKPRELYNPDLRERVYARVHPSLRPILQKATSYLREDRQRDAGTLVAELRAVFDELPEDPPEAPTLGSAPAASEPADVGQSATSGPPVIDKNTWSVTNERSLPSSSESRASKTPFMFAFVLAGLALFAGIPCGAGGVWLVISGMEVSELNEPSLTAADTEPVVTEAPAQPVEEPVDEPPAQPPPIHDPTPPVEPAGEEVATVAPVRPPPTQEVPPPETPMGVLFVNSVPPSSVTVGGIDHGTTPQRLSVSLGSHQIRLQRDGHADVIRVLAVSDLATPKRFCWDFNEEGPCPRF